MLLMPIEPDACSRHATPLLAADLMRFGGANQKELWLGYAQAGHGRQRRQLEHDARHDIDPVPDFEPVGSKPTTVKFKAENDDGDRDQRPDLRRSLRGPCLTDCRHESHDDGTDQPRRHGQVRPGQVRVRRACARLRVTFASTSISVRATGTRTRHGRSRSSSRPTGLRRTSGATVTTPNAGATVGGPDRRHRGHADGPRTRTTNVAPDAGDLTVDGKQATVDLGGTQGDSRPLRPGQRPASGRTAAGSRRCAQFELWACDSHGVATARPTQGSARCTRARIDAFPGDPPRPVAPHLILRKFDTPDFKATHVRFVVKHEPVHRRGRLPGRPGRRSGEQPGLRLERPAATLRGTSSARPSFRCSATRPDIDD